jgi:hypothetical protein
MYCGVLHSVSSSFHTGHSVAGHAVVGECQAIGSSKETLSGWVTDTVADQWLSPPAVGTLPCGWATAHNIMTALMRATAVPKTTNRSVFDVERFTVEILSWPVMSQLQKSSMTLMCLWPEHCVSYTQWPV